jgi:hypothetical protein
MANAVRKLATATDVPNRVTETDVRNRARGSDVPMANAVRKLATANVVLNRVTESDVRNRARGSDVPMANAVRKLATANVVLNRVTATDVRSRVTAADVRMGNEGQKGAFRETENDVPRVLRETATVRGRACHVSSSCWIAIAMGGSVAMNSISSAKCFESLTVTQMGSLIRPKSWVLRCRLPLDGVRMRMDGGRMRHRSETASADQTVLRHVTVTDAVLKVHRAMGIVAPKERQETVSVVPARHHVTGSVVPEPSVLHRGPIENETKQIGRAIRTGHERRTKGNNNLQSVGRADRDAA